jgi:peptidoglycan/LPS O-acetylase OafA/YrhL
MILKNKRLTIILLTALLLLLMPLIAMQFASGVNWTLFDFIAAGVLLFGTGLLCELVLQKVKKTEYRIAICAGILILLLIIWAELAIGIFGTRFGGQ